MSCYIIGDDKIDFILSFLKLKKGGYFFIQNKGHLVNLDKADESTRDFLNLVGNILKQENHTSVNTRYKENTICTPYEFQDKFLGGTGKVFQALKALDEYDYQTSESPDYNNSEAFKLINHFRKIFVSMIPQYQEIQGW